ncbi:MAG: hypothetical protein EOM54_11990 [Clostridia bacterium]|nr:hypothetical protein [Clostridia bacterium]
MKKRTLLTILIVIVICAVCGVIGFAYSNGYFVFSRAETEAEVNMDVINNTEPLVPDRDNPSAGVSKVAISLEWGEEAEYVKMTIYQEGEDGPISYDTPSSYTVGPDGKIYIADTLNHELKVFSDNELIQTIELPEARYQENPPSAIPFVLRDIDVDDSGNIYGLNYLADELVFISSKDGTTETVFPELSLQNPWTVDVLCSGDIMIRDNVNAENATRVRKVDSEGNVLSEKKLANMIDFDLYQYEDINGNIIEVTPYAVKEYQLSLTDGKTGETVASVDFIARNPNDMECNVSLLGTDNDGRVYFHLRDTPPYGKLAEIGVDQFFAESKEYICRIDIQNGTIETIYIQNTDHTMSSSTANLSNKLIRMDNGGNVYQLMMNENGYTIYSYSFS